MDGTGYQSYFQAMSRLFAVQAPDFRTIDVNNRSHLCFQALLEQRKDDVEP
jgi:hypothetical protein